MFKDRLEKVNGNTITYGTNPMNPSSWDGNTYTFEGRRLVKCNSSEYTYNDQGLRISKKVNNNTTKYYYDQDKLITEVAPSYKLDFLYDENDQLYGFVKDNSEKYYYVRDFMQNILGIIDNEGNLVVKYDYTAYGTINSITGTLSSTIGQYNPFRYKGYYYDTEIKMYYCRSRYYVPEWCRWLNGDSVGYLNPQDINGMNLFAYCNNNPVMGIDTTGHFFLSALIIGAVIGLATYSVTQTVRTQQYINENYTGSSKFWFTLSNFTLGFAATSIISFNEKNIELDAKKDGWARVDFSKNKNYNFFTSFQYANALEKKGLPEGRSAKGIWFELLSHHLINSMDIFDCTEHDDIADMGPFSEDRDAILWELPFILLKLSILI